MKIWRSCLARLVVASLFATGAIGAAVVAEEGTEVSRRFTVRDSIEMSYFGNLFGSQLPKADEDGIYSPDGRYYARLTHRGVLPGGLIESTIWVFDVEAVRKALSIKQRESHAELAIPLVRLSADVNGGSLTDTPYNGTVIRELQWSSDSRSIAFRAHVDATNSSVFVAELPSGKLTQLTPKGLNVELYNWSGDNMVFLAHKAMSEEEIWASAGWNIPDVTSVTGQSLLEVLYPNAARHIGVTSVSTLWVARKTDVRPVIDAQTGKPLEIATFGQYVSLTISPDGRQAVVTSVAREIPKHWEQYEVGSAYPNISMPIVADTGSASAAQMKDKWRPEQYILIDLQAGMWRPVPDAPIAGPLRGWLLPHPKAVWSSDGRFLALLSVYRPLIKGAGTNRLDQKYPCGVAIVEALSGKMQCLAGYGLERKENLKRPTDIRWGAQNELLISYLVGDVRTRSAQKIYQDTFRFTGQQWTRAVGDPRRSEGPQVEFRVRESLNKPPVLVARDTVSGRERVVLDPNPQLANIQLGQAEVFRWKDHRGRSLTAGLIKPPNFVPNRRYPLVIQTHGFSPGAFLKNGGMETAAAARAIAARDIVVLQVQEPNDPMGTEESIENGAKVYVSALDAILSEGFIDGGKVGISGYSRTGPYVATSLVLFPDRFAAAALANTEAGTYLGYLAGIDIGGEGIQRDFATAIGAGVSPYGKGLETWISKVPGFNTHAIRSPVLLTAGDPQHLVNLWGFYAPLRDQKRAVELQYMRTGQHNLSKVSHRLVHQEALVDWFDFWLNQHEDDNASKSEQYARWRALRDLHAHQTK